MKDAYEICKKQIVNFLSYGNDSESCILKVDVKYNRVAVSYIGIIFEILKRKKDRMVLSYIFIEDFVEIEQPRVNKLPSISELSSSKTDKEYHKLLLQEVEDFVSESIDDVTDQISKICNDRDIELEFKLIYSNSMDEPLEDNGIVELKEDKDVILNHIVNNITRDSNKRIEILYETKVNDSPYQLLQTFEKVSSSSGARMIYKLSNPIIYQKIYEKSFLMNIKGSNRFIDTVIESIDICLELLNKVSSDDNKITVELKEK